jgi:transposase
MVRNSVERFLRWLKGFRRLGMRHERLATTSSGLVHIACLVINWKALQ